ncbi:MAG: phosphopantetheine-binding protein [Candidatus Cloacimonetes bacterium]|nr:phosphopantetheine-binding protein [Candidatus Cloacimonadota bacterium]MDY0366071.1 phosphopantetheine-binding protein [Candidatus Syntrophosphaera sp.]
MTLQTFMQELVELIEIEADLSLDSNLKDYEEYDSMAIMSLVAYIHKNFGKQFNARQLNNIDTVQSLVDLIGEDSFN